MKFEPDPFFQSARSIALTDGEFDEIRKNMRNSVTKENWARLESTMDQTNFLTSAQKLSLRPAEKAQIRAAIMEGITVASPSHSPFHRLLRIFSRATAVLMIFLLCGASVSYAAESALPGDALYTVKVNFNESILLRMNKSAESKARVQARLMSRRLEEAEKLAEKSRLTAERVVIVEKRLRAHVMELEADLLELATLDQETSGSIAIDTAAEMEAHENLLQRIHNDNDPKDVERLVAETRKARNIAEKITFSTGIRNITELKSRKADDEIKKTKTAKTWHARVGQDADIAQTIITAETDLKESNEAAVAAEIRVKKAASALKKAKEAKFMLLLHSHTKLKVRGKEERPEDFDAASSTSSSVEMSSSLSISTNSSSVASSEPTTSSSTSNESSVSVSSSHTSSASSSVTSSRSSSASRTSSSTAKRSSESASSSRSTSVRSSAPIGSEIKDILKEADNLIKKTLP